MTLRALWRSLRLLAAPRAVERDLDDEMRAHLELQTRRHLEEGMLPDEARRAAEREFGSLVAAKRAVRSVHSAPTASLVDTFACDLRFAARSLLRHRGFAGMTLLVLAGGLAAVTVMFSVVSGVLLRPLPFAHPEQVVAVWGRYQLTSLAGTDQPLHGRSIKLMREQGQAFQSVAGFVPRQFNLGNGATPERIDGVEVTADFFQTIGVTPPLGRAFRPEEENPGSDHAIVIGWSLWQRRFGADPGAVGRSVILDGEAYTIVGVAPAGFAFPRGAEMPAGFQMPPFAEIWVPKAPPQRGPSLHAAIARVRPGVTLAQAQGDLDRITKIQEELQPAGKGWFNFRAVPLRTQLVGDVQFMLLALLGAVAVLLTIACVNAAQLLLGRLQARQKELAVRAALGASTARLVGVLLCESLLLTGLAGALGMAIGWAGIQALKRYGPAQIPRLADIGFDIRVLAATIVITLLAGMVFGVVPALSLRRARLAEALRRGGRRAGDQAVAPRIRRALITAEVALSVVLVAGSGLLVRSLSRQLSGDLGFSASHAFTFEVTLPPLTYPEQQFATYKEHPKSVPFLTDVLARIGAIPGVSVAALGKPLPMSGAQESTVFAADASPLFTAESKEAPVIDYTVASPGMFGALGATLQSGRDFDRTDREESVPVVIINAAAARWLWPGETAVGRRLKLGGNANSPAPWLTVVGVVGDMKRYSLTEEPRPEMFVPYTQKPYPSFAPMQFIVRGTADIATLVGPIQRAIAAVDPTIPLARVRAVDDLVSDMSANARFATLTMSFFGVVALALAMIGLYGVVAYSVAQRRQEFGVRSALGASRPQIVRLVLRDGLGLTVVGLVGGGLLALLAGRFLRSMLYQVSTVDPITLAATAALLLLATVCACVLPARRASSVDPRVALDDG